MCGAGLMRVHPGSGRLILLHVAALACHSCVMKISRHLLVVLLVTGLLNGCAALLVGGAAGGAAGAYYVEKDKRGFEAIASDAGITSSINTKFIQDDLVSAIDVNVDTHNGVVTLKGVVNTHEVARRAYDIAYSVEGVTQVISKLTIRSEPMSPWGPVSR